MRIDYPKIGKYLLHVLLPAVCAHCKEDLHYLDGGPLCPSCRGRLEPVPGLYCKKCGLPLESGGEHCHGCRGKKSAGPPDLAVSAFVFNPELRALVHEFKYRGRRELAAFLGLELAKAWDRYPELKPYTFVLPVPLHRKKEKERGFNQSRLLAEALCRERQLFLLEGAAERVKNTPSQTGLTKKERLSNMAGAFRVPAPGLVKGRRVLIIDDVATTLATASELAARLKEAGAAGTAVFTLAREPQPAAALTIEGKKSTIE